MFNNYIFDTKLLTRSFDQLIGNNDLLHVTILIIFHSLIIHAYLIYTNKLRGYYSKIKNEKIFINLFFDNTMIAIIEQACYVVYVPDVLKLLKMTRHFTRVLISLVYCISHTITFNLFYETLTIVFQLVNSFLIMMIYLKNDILFSLLLNVYCNTVWIIINYLVYKFLLSTRLLQGKIYFAPINIDNSGDTILSPFNLNEPDNDQINKFD